MEVKPHTVSEKRAVFEGVRFLEDSEVFRFFGVLKGFTKNDGFHGFHGFSLFSWFFIVFMVFIVFTVFDGFRRCAGGIGNLVGSQPIVPG